MATNLISKEVLQELLNKIAESLAEKAESTHNHEIGDINGLDTRLTDIMDAVGNITSFKVQIVNTIDEVVAENIIYFISKGDGTYEEYMLIGGNKELIGNTSVDLTEYVKTADVNAQIQTLQQSINEKVDKTTYDTKVQALEQSITNVDNKSTQNQTDIGNLTTVVQGLNTALQSKSDAVHTHEITDVNLLQDTLDDKVNKTDYDLKVADIEGKIPTKTSDLNNDSGFITTAELANYATTEALTNGLSTKANNDHEHVMADITDLQDTLDLKADLTYVNTELDKKMSINDYTIETDIAVANTMWQSALSSLTA